MVDAYYSKGSVYKGIPVLKDRQLWYVRHAEAVSGPFPNQVVAQHVLLGRLDPTDEVSMDQLEWQPLETVRELFPVELLQIQAENDPERKQWLEERIKAAHRWADERTHQDRRQYESSGGTRTDERRKTRLSNDVLALPHRHPELERWSSRWRSFGAISVIASLILLVILGLTFYRPINPLKVGVVPELPQCQHAASPRINWSGCDKQTVRLRGADLSSSNLTYANFSGADLSGSRLSASALIGLNFTRANLDNVDFSGSDLSYSDLRGASMVSAILRNTVLDRAIWVDGRECAVGSVGQCR